MNDLEALSSDLRELFSDEREAYVEDLAAKARVHRRIESALLLGGGVAAATALLATPKSTTADMDLRTATYAKGWIVLSFATGIVVGETHSHFSRKGPVVSPSVPAEVRTSSTGAPLPPQESPAVSVSALPRVVPPQATAWPTNSVRESASNLAAEQSLIDTARSALSRGRGSDALVAIQEHARRFPNGRLSEEREMLGIQALLLNGRKDEAVVRAKQFHKSYPKSLYASAVDALVSAAEDGAR